MSDMPPPPPDDSGWSSSQPPAPPPVPGGHADPKPQAMAGWADRGIGMDGELASPLARLGARIIDWAIVAVVVAICAAAGFLVLFGVQADDLNSGEQSAVGVVALLALIALAAVVGIAYEVTMIAVRGQTLGKMVARVMVVRADDGSIPGWGKSFGRWIIPAAAGFVPYVGFILVLLVYLSLTWDKDRQGWHDKAAATLVIKV